MYIGFIIEYCIINNDEIVVFYRSLDSIIILIVSSTVLLIFYNTYDASIISLYFIYQFY
jgi:hypothetical protein